MIEVIVGIIILIIGIYIMFTWSEAGRFSDVIKKSKKEKENEEQQPQTEQEQGIQVDNTKNSITIQAGDGIIVKTRDNYPVTITPPKFSFDDITVVQNVEKKVGSDIIVSQKKIKLFSPGRTKCSEVTILPGETASQMIKLAEKEFKLSRNENHLLMGPNLSTIIGDVYKALNDGDEVIIGRLEQGAGYDINKDNEISQRRNDESTSKRKFPDIDFPSHIKLNQKYPLVVRLLEESVKDTTDELTLVVLYSKGVKQIEILVTIDAKDFEIEEPEMIMKVPINDKSAPIVFYLTPKSVGEKNIRLKFYQDENYNGEIFIDTIVHEEDDIDEYSGKAIPRGDVGIYTNRQEQADLRIEVENHDNHLVYKVTSKVMEIDLKKFRVEEELHEPRQFIFSLLDELSEMSSSSYTDEIKYENIINKIENAGKDLYKRLIPEDLKRILWKYKEKIRSIFIVTDEEWIPWEIIKPFRVTEKNNTEIDEFWCMKYIISRWFSPHFAFEQITIKKSTIIAYDFKGKLKNVKMEKEKIENILIINDIKTIPIEPKRLEILGFLSDNDINLIHFASDCEYDNGNPDNSNIKLSDYNLRVKDINVTNLKKGKPLVFINACDSGRLNYTFCGLGGFAKAFLDGGAQAFIGPLWKIPDSLGKEFSIEFYRQLFMNELSVGEALLATRLKFENSNNPAWLSYSLFSFPLLKVHT